ncbi:hypothetical protein CMO91_02815 [Candidatus Woesearchaeota archaeon]|nr:hypothetical protein [Candidatus Woesearchaeota archaeon]
MREPAYFQQAHWRFAAPLRARGIEVTLSPDPDGALFDFSLGPTTTTFFDGPREFLLETLRDMERPLPVPKAILLPLKMTNELFGVPCFEYDQLDDIEAFVKGGKRWEKLWVC